MSASTQPAQPSPLPQPASRKPSGGVDRTMPARRKQKAKGQRKRKAIAGAAPIPGAAAHAPPPRAIAQPLPGHRLPRTLAGHPATGVPALTNSLMVLCGTFTGEISASGIVPTAQNCTHWVAILQACLDAVAMPAKAA